jgi:uncharacterized protein (DUF2141 family)
MKQFIFILLVLIISPGFSQILLVDISGIRRDKGVIQLSVYRDKETFASETPFRIYNFPKTKMVDGKIVVSINDLTAGTYGIALIDDENENGKIDRRFFVPCEGFGFSNYQFKGTCKPSFDAFAFQFSEEKTTVKIEVQYF